MTLLRGFFTADVTVLFELDRLLTRLEAEFNVNGKPLPEKLARARSEMRTLLGVEHSTTHGSTTVEHSVAARTTGPTMVGVMEAATILGQSPQSIRRHCTAGDLHAVQGVKNGSWRIFRASVDARKQEMGMS
jgi:hypothetical protein